MHKTPVPSATMISPVLILTPAHMTGSPIERTFIRLLPGVGTICLENAGKLNSIISSLSLIPPSTTKPPIPFNLAEYEAIPPQVETGAPLLATTITSPGLAIRMPGIITKEKINILKEADYFFIKALKDHKLYDKIWQAYAALLPVKTVGVMGDNRTYEYLCLLRAITSEDGMTADFYDFKKSFIQMISNKIVNSIRGINRVVYDVTSKPPSTIELE